MRLLPQLAAALAVLSTAIAVDQTKSAIVWFEDPATSDAVVNQAKDALIMAGGRITHVYTIIKGFAVTAPGKALESLQAMDIGHDMRVEEDEMVSSQG